jgi:NAD(P)-dependent dehydrogenase (short-subunit alcohol dehydrogenase family)
VDDLFDLSGRVALVTGGTRGIGLAIAERLAAAGATVVTCGRTPPDEHPYDFRRCDVREPDQVADLTKELVAEHGRLDIAVNNAGGSPTADAATASPRFHEAIVRLNLLAPLNVSQAANAIMQTQDDGGVILNVASVSGIRPSPGTAAYGAAKAGLLSLTKSLAVEWAPKVRVNAVVAGLIETPDSLDHYGGPEGLRRVAATVPLGRMGSPADVAGACLFLASSAAGYVSGAQLLLHGGGERPVFLGAAGL